MKFKDIIAISNMGGLYEVIKQRPDGVIARALNEKRNRYVSNRIHTFSPLDKIGIFTENNDSEPLGYVLRSIQLFEENGNTLPHPKKSSSSILKNFLGTILPDYDEERVYVSDIKKLIKWYLILKKYDGIPTEEELKEAEQEAAEAMAKAEAAEAEE